MRRLGLVTVLCLLPGCGDRDPPSWSLVQGEEIRSDLPGRTEGEQLPPDLSWEGLPGGSTTPGTIVLGDYHDETGSRGIHALLIMQGTTTCPACQRAAAELPARLSGGWDALGVAVIDLLIEGATGQPATVQDASEWQQAMAATWAVGADPAFTFARVGINYLPVYVLINPRTLQVETRLEGYQPDVSFVDAMAQSNAP